MPCFMPPAPPFSACSSPAPTSPAPGSPQEAIAAQTDPKSLPRHSLPDTLRDRFRETGDGREALQGPLVFGSLLWLSRN
jgi:hypothetical protein